MAANQPEYGLPCERGRKKRSGFSWLWLLFLVAAALGSMGWATQRVAEFYNYSPELGSPVFWQYHWPWQILNWYLAYGGQSKFIVDSVNYATMLFCGPILLACYVYLMFFGRRPKGNDNLHGSAHWAREKEILDMTLLEGQGVYVGGWVKRVADGEWLASRLRRFAACGLGLLLYISPFKVKKAQAFVDETKKVPPPARESLLYLRHDGPEHILAFAPTRSGKGVGLILPTLYAWPESSVVFDIKGENYALTSGWLKSIGNTVIRFDPSDPTGTSAGFNPLEEVRLDTLYAIPDVQNIATMIVDPEGKGLQDHWGKAGFAFIAGVLLHCLVMVRHKEKRSATLYDLGNMMADENRDLNALYQEMLETPHEALINEIFPPAEEDEEEAPEEASPPAQGQASADSPALAPAAPAGERKKKGAVGGDKIHTFIASSAREMKNKAANEASGVVSTALVNLALYRDPIVAMNTSRCDFRISDLMNAKKPVNLYLVISPADRKRLRPLLRLIITLFVNRLTAKMEFKNGRSVKGYEHRLLLMLDEFTALGKLESIEEAIAFMAGYGLKGYFIVQDVVQLNAVYGKDNALMSNCHIRIAYAPNTIDTAKMLSEMAGKTTVVEKKTSISGSRSGRLGNASVSVSETSRPLLTPDECMRLPGPTKNARGDVLDSGDMLIFIAGKSTIYGKQILYFRDPVFSARARMLAPAQSDRLKDGAPIVQKVAENKEQMAARQAAQAQIIESTKRYFETEEEFGEAA